MQPIDSDEEDSGLMLFSGNEDASEDDDLEDLFQNSPVIEIENEDFEAYDNPAQEPGTPLADCAPSEEEESPESEGLNGNYWNSSGLPSRPRNADPQYVFMAQIRALNDLADQYDLFDRKLDKAIKDLESNHPGDNALHLLASSFMALSAQKDMSWKRALAGPQRKSAIEAFDKELSSLEDTILT